jgi:asparagine synthase (glutamine-hydrolysing)
LTEETDRSLARRAMWGSLPNSVLCNPLRGAQAPDWFEKLEQRRPQLRAELAELGRSPMVRKAIDLARLQRALDNWPHGNWHHHKVVNEYQLALPRGLATGRFLRWFERTN